MKKLSLFRSSEKVKAKEINEYQLSLIIHFFLLLALSIIMGLKAIPKNKPKIMPVTLVAQIDKPKAGAIADVKKDIGSKKAEGNTNKVVKAKTATPVKAPKAKSNAKPVQKASAKPTTKPNAKKAPVTSAKAEQKLATKTSVAKATTATTPIVAVKPAQTNLPSVISIPTTSDAPVKPSHNVPLFEEVSDLSTGLSKSNPTFENMGNPSNVADNSMLMPDSMLDDSKMFASPEEITTPVTGKTNGNKGNGLFEVGSIEAFGGNSESFIAPKIISRVQPEYPDWARKQGVHGTAVYRVLIQPSGTVGDVVTMSSTIDPKLAITGAQALRRWVFTPVLSNGVPQETWVKISVQYELN